MDKYALVLAGGGAKGGYEIGAWKALKELEIPIGLVAGTSVGALNSAMIVQNDYDNAYNLWTNISMEQVISMGEAAAADEIERKSMLETLAKGLVSGGLDVTPLKNLISSVVDEEKVRNSPIDLGIITFSLSDFKPVSLFKEDIPEGKLSDYLIASASFPAFKPQEIDSKRFIDGGVADNIPVSLAVKKGYKKIIVIDISGPGFNKKTDTKDAEVTYIKTTEDLGGTLDFNGEKSISNIELGYYDTMKAFKKYRGFKYFLIPSKDFEENANKFMNSLSMNDFKGMYSFLGLSWKQKLSVDEKLILDRVIRTIQSYSEDGRLSLSNIFPAMAEITAEQLEIDKLPPVTLEELIEKILKKYEEIKSSSDFNEYMKNSTKLLLSRNQREFDKERKNTLIEGKFIITYAANLKENSENIKRFRRLIAMGFPKISVANLFISLLQKNN